MAIVLGPPEFQVGQVGPKGEWGKLNGEKGLWTPEASSKC